MQTQGHSWSLCGYCSRSLSWYWRSIQSQTLLCNGDMLPGSLQPSTVHSLLPYLVMLVFPLRWPMAWVQQPAAVFMEYQGGIKVCAHPSLAITKPQTPPPYFWGYKIQMRGLTLCLCESSCTFSKCFGLLVKKKPTSSIPHTPCEVERFLQFLDIC